MADNKNSYMENGISISPKSISQNQKVKLSYEGLLAKSGATQVYAHIGYGEKWDDQATYPMSNKEGKFEVSFEVKNSGTLNLCFKDALDNWDNNSSENYTFSIKDPGILKAIKASKPTAKATISKEVADSVVEVKPKKARSKKSEVQ